MVSENESLFTFYPDDCADVSKIGITSPQLELECQISYLQLSNSMNLVYFDLLYQDFRTELILIPAQVLHNHPH